MAIILPDRLSDLSITSPTWEWRGAQKSLAERIANSTKPIIMLEAECGTGKSLIPLAAARALGSQALVLIRTIQLQEQYLRDIAGLVMLTGRSHYVCELTNLSADLAPCTVGYPCGLKGQWTRDGKPLTLPDCSYYREKAIAAKSQFAILNYAYWLREIKSRKSSFNQVDWIICDEAHEIEQVLMDAGVISLYRTDIRTYAGGMTGIKTVEQLIQWAQAKKKTISDIVEEYRDQAVRAGLIQDSENDTQVEAIVDPKSAEGRAMLEHVRHSTRFLESLEELALIQKDETSEWVLVPEKNTIDVRPINGKPAFNKIRSCAKDKIILMSAFLAPNALMRSLGLTEDEVEVIIAPEVYNRKNSRIFYCPTVKMGYNTTDAEWNYSIAVASMIADVYKDRKGIIHVPSVTLRDKILSTVPSHIRKRLVVYDGNEIDIIRRVHPTKTQALEQFISSSEPLILLGQSVSTGIDLPYIPKWQIIFKLSFPPITNPAIAERHKRDKLFYNYITVCELVQAAGRIKRAADHDGPTFILDAQFGWFSAKMRDHFPSWFRKALVRNGWDQLTFLKRQLNQVALANGLIIQDKVLTP